MVVLVLEPEVEALLRQVAADLDLTPEAVGTVVLSSALLSHLDD